MTHAMPIFINSLFPVLDGTNAMDNQVKILIEEARKSVALAEKEMRYADIAFAQTGSDPDNPNLKLAEIARWHYAQTIRYYGEAIEQLESAAKRDLPAKYKKYVALRTKKGLEEMAYANERKIRLGVILRTVR